MGAKESGIIVKRLSTSKPIENPFEMISHFHADIPGFLCERAEFSSGNPTPLSSCSLWTAIMQLFVSGKS